MPSWIPWVKRERYPGRRSLLTIIKVLTKEYGMIVFRQLSKYLNIKA